MNQYTAGPQALISAAQTITGSWADLGPEVGVGGAKWAGIFLNVDIDTSVNIRVRVLAKHTEDHADEFSLPIKTVGSSVVLVEAEYFELNVDSDQKIMLSVDLDRLVPFIQVQVQAGTVGGTPQIDAAHLTWAY